MPLSFDIGAFNPDRISEQTQEFNRTTVEMLEGLGSPWRLTPSQLRAARTEGKGPFPIGPPEKTATVISVDAGDHSIPVRVFKPKAGSPKGSYLHIHGGGWTLGSADGQDARMQEIADRCQLACLSVEYRLAPESPYPAGPNDCETVARWLVKDQEQFPKEFLAIGGESAGANLSVVTLLRLRERNLVSRFHAAILIAGVYDLGLSASARNWGTERLILNTPDLEMFIAHYLQDCGNVRSPDVSPLFADLHDLPPALFSIGTHDMLLDDTIQMAARWKIANNNAELEIAPGGCHDFQRFRELDIAQQSNERIDTFLNERRKDSS
ncbi:MAG: alpha/beta hydrolase [Pseudomonadota bacterium]